MRLVALLIAATLEVAPSPSRWPSGSAILVWIDPSTAPAGAEALVVRALATWTDTVIRRITLERTTVRADAGIRVRFARSSGEYGGALPRIDPRTGAIAGADVLIATDTAGDDQLAQRIVIYMTALHELGHAIGL